MYTTSFMRTVKSEESVYQRTEYIELASQAAKTLLKHKQASAAAEMANSMLTVFQIINAQMMSIEKVRGHFYWTLQRIRKSQNDKNASDQVKWYLPHSQRSIKQPNQTLHQQHLRLFFNLQRATATWRFAGISATHLPRLYIIIYLQ